MQQILLVVQVLAAVALIAIVLLQQGRGADAGAAFGSGGAGTIFGARGPTTVLTRATAILALVFFVNSLALSYLASRTIERRSVVERFEEVVPNDSGTLDVSPADVPALPEQAGDVPVMPGAQSDVPTLPPEDEKTE